MSPAGRWWAGLAPGPLIATWILFVLAAPFQEEGFSAETLLVGGLAGALLVTTGFLATVRVRPAVVRPPPAQARLALLAVAVGAAVAVWHVGSNLILAGLDADVRARLVERFVLRPEWGSTFSAAVVEEVVFRLCLFSVISWLALRLLGPGRAVFWVGLLGSAALFAVPHLWGRPPAGAGLVGVAYQGLIVFDGVLGGVVLGWVFWRWGLLHAMICHFVIDAVVLLVGPLVLS